MTLEDMQQKASTLGAILYRLMPWKDSFVAAPLSAMIVNVVVSSLLAQLTTSDDPALIEKGLRMLGLVSGAAISIVTLTFSLTVLSVQIAAQTYSPRLLDEFLKDPMSKVVISVNLGAYAFCYTLTYFLDDTNPGAEVPYVAIHVLSVHMTIILVAFVNFIHFFINGFRIETILSKSSAGAYRAALALSAEMNTELKREEQPEIATNAYKVLADESGYVTHFCLRNLTQKAKEMDLILRYKHQIGDYVNRGTLLCYVWDAKTQKDDDKESASLGKRVMENNSYNKDDIKRDDNKSWDEKVERRLGEFASEGINLSKQRNSDFDVTLGIQQIVDIAVRALSPGINDPQTAIQCMDVLTSLLADLAVMELGVPNARDEDDVIRVCAPRRSFSYILSMLDGIRGYGGSDLSVCRRGLRLFGDLGAIVTRTGRNERLPGILTQLEQWMVVSRESFSKNSPELSSLEELNEHVLRNIAESVSMVMKDGSGVKDLQDFETTYKSGKEEDGSSAKVSSSSMVMDFLKEVTSANTSFMSD